MVPVVGAKQSHPWVDPENMERVVRDNPGRDGFSQVAPVGPGPGTEPVEQGITEQLEIDLIQEVAADPVRLNHSPVERVRDSGGGRDELQVGPGTLERLGKFDQASIDDPGGAVFQQCSVLRRSAISPFVGWIGVACEEDGAGRVGYTTVVGWLCHPVSCGGWVTMIRRHREVGASFSVHQGPGSKNPGGRVRGTQLPWSTT